MATREPCGLLKRGFRSILSIVSNSAARVPRVFRLRPHAPIWCHNTGADRCGTWIHSPTSLNWRSASFQPIRPGREQADLGICTIPSCSPNARLGICVILMFRSSSWQCRGVARTPLTRGPSSFCWTFKLPSLFALPTQSPLAFLVSAFAIDALARTCHSEIRRRTAQRTRLCLSQASSSMMHHQSLSPPLEVLSLHRSTPTSHSDLRSHSPGSALTATYSTYVVRVHTRHGIKTISFDVLAAFFTYTAKKAAEDLGISSRTLIRVCRSLGIRRWPYLGFRSEKNVERIRQEAIENLRRKLERESNEASSSSSSATASCLRGASAKRLLQVNVPTQPGMTGLRGFERLSVFTGRSLGQGHHFSPHSRTHCVHTVVSPSAQTHYHRHMHHHGTGSSLPMLTPPSTHHSFNLEMRPSAHPRRLPHAHAAVTSFRKQHLPPNFGPVHHEASSPSSMPSLNVLMDASILTTFKHEVETHLARPAESVSMSPTESDAQHHARTMSMRDILANTATA